MDLIDAMAILAFIACMALIYVMALMAVMANRIQIAYPSKMTDLPTFAVLPHTTEILVALVKIVLNTEFNLTYFDFSEMHVDLNGYFNPVMQGLERQC